MASQEKLSLLQDRPATGAHFPHGRNGTKQEQPSRYGPFIFRLRSGLLGLCCLLWATHFFIVPFLSSHSHHHHHHASHFSQQCPQVDPLFPSQKSDALASMDEYLASPQFLNASVPRLSGAVQIHSESFDDMGPVGEDPRWDVMYDVAAYLERTFPLVHSTLTLEKVNTHGLLYTWPGTDASLKPTVLMAHQDTVPVEKATVDQWTYPPWSGAFDGRYVWGRGAGDCKNTLVGILEAVELLADAGFAPRRTLVLSFGFDEESAGVDGAGRLAGALLARYGAGGAAVLVDEGEGLRAQWGTLFATPAVGEKGFLNVDVVVRMPGGHSSVPPRHNGIGAMAEMIRAVEANLYEPHFHEENPFLGQLRCGAAHAADFPPKLGKELRRRDGRGRGKGRGGDAEGTCAAGGKKDHLALEAAKQSDLVKYLFTTSVAADLISGGAKVNALPERTVLTVNHRVNVGDRTAHVKEHMARVLAPVAARFNLTLHAFPSGAEGDAGETPSSVTLKTALGTGLEPAPVTPTDVLEGETTPWEVLSGTTRALYGEGLVMAPGLSTGNTDTRFYWDLTRHIFRFMPGYDPEEVGLGNIHTVNEKISMRNHVSAVRWFSLFIRNMDEAEL